MTLQSDNLHCLWCWWLLLLWVRNALMLWMLCSSLCKIWRQILAKIAPLPLDTSLLTIMCRQLGIQSRWLYVRSCSTLLR